MKMLKSLVSFIALLSFTLNAWSLESETRKRKFDDVMRNGQDRDVIDQVLGIENLSFESAEDEGSLWHSHRTFAGYVLNEEGINHARRNGVNLVFPGRVSRLEDVEKPIFKAENPAAFSILEQLVTDASFRTIFNVIILSYIGSDNAGLYTSCKFMRQYTLERGVHLDSRSRMKADEYEDWESFIYTDYIQVLDNFLRTSGDRVRKLSNADEGGFYEYLSYFTHLEVLEAGDYITPEYINELPEETYPKLTSFMANQQDDDMIIQRESIKNLQKAVNLEELQVCFECDEDLSHELCILIKKLPNLSSLYLSLRAVEESVGEKIYKNALSSLPKLNNLKEFTLDLCDGYKFYSADVSTYIFGIPNLETLVLRIFVDEDLDETFVQQLVQHFGSGSKTLKMFSFDVVVVGDEDEASRTIVGIKIEFQRNREKLQSIFPCLEVIEFRDDYRKTKGTFNLARTAMS